MPPQLEILIEIIKRRLLQNKNNFEMQFNPERDQEIDTFIADVDTSNISYSPKSKKYVIFQFQPTWTQFCLLDFCIRKQTDFPMCKQDTEKRTQQIR